MSDNSSAGGGGIGFLGLLTIVFITLKLCGVINWSWLWVLSPIWIPLSLGMVVLAVVGLVLGVSFLLERRDTKRRSRRVRQWELHRRN